MISLISTIWYYSYNGNFSAPRNRSRDINGSYFKVVEFITQLKVMLMFEFLGRCMQDYTENQAFKELVKMNISCYLHRSSLDCPSFWLEGTDSMQHSFFSLFSDSQGCIRRKSHITLSQGPTEWFWVVKSCYAFFLINFWLFIKHFDYNNCIVVVILFLNLF